MKQSLLLMRTNRVLLSLWLATAALPAAESTPNPAPAPTPAPGQPAPAQAAPAATGPVKKLSLEDCVQRALEHNLNLQIQRLNPEIYRYAVSLAYAGYDPNFNVGGSHYFSTSPGSVDRVTRLTLPPGTVDANGYNSSVSGLTPLGLTYNLNANVAESYGRRGVIPFESTSGSGTISLTQPLLKNLWIDSTRMNIWVSKKNLKESELALRYQIMTIVTSVEQAYYDLIAFRENIEVQKIALSLAERLLAENRERVRVGAMAQLDEEQAKSRVAASRAALIAAQQTLAVGQNALKGLIHDNFASWESTVIEPAESLTAVPQAFSLQDSWNKGLSLRPDLLQARLEVEKQDILLRYNRNQLFPELDLVGSYGHAGANSLSRDFGGVLGQLENGSSPSYSYGATLTFPLSMRSARYNYKTSKAQRQQLVLQLKQKEQTIMIDIDNAVKQAKTSYERVDSTKAAQVYAEAALDAEQKKLQSGKSTSFVVLQLQSDLTNARSAYIQAITDYNKALAQLALAEGFVLERNHLSLKVR